MSKETRFTLKAGDRLERGAAPAIARRAFTITAKFEAGVARDGVIVAHGGAVHGCALFLAEGRLHFIVRSSSGSATVSTTGALTLGVHAAVARLDPQGAMTLALDGQPPATARARGLIASMPADGLDVGADRGGLVGPYPAANDFPGRIESIIIELDAP